MKKIVSQIWLGLICIILGFMLTFQFKASSSTQIKSSSRKYQDMANELESLNKQKDDLNAKVNEYQQKVDKYEKAAANDSTYAKNMKDELDKLRKLAGVEDVHGRGLEITITPPVDVVQSEYSSISYDLILSLVNEINSTNEAEAIAINDERYTGRTEIRAVGNVIKINDRKFDPDQQFIIKIIGDPAMLRGAFTIPGNILDQIEGFGFDVKTMEQDDIKILKYSRSLEYKYIK